MSVGAVLIFANPIAGRGRGRAIAERLGNRLAGEGYVPWVVTQAANEIDPAKLPDAPVAAIVIGGDGTLRNVAGLLATQHSVFPPMLVVPFGTANLMGRHLGIDWHPRTMIDEITDALKNGNVTHLDAARANGKLFLLMAGVGLDAQIVHQFDALRSGPIAMIDYALPAAMSLINYRYPPINVTVDGQTVVSNEPAIAFVGNVREYGTGFPVLPDARPDDGLLDICVLPCKSYQDVAKIFLRIMSNEHRSREGAIYLRGRSVKIDSPAQVPVQLDGDAAGHTPLEIDLLPARVPFIVP